MTTNIKPKKTTKMFVDYNSLTNRLKPKAFKSNADLNAVPKFNEHGDNIDPVIRLIAIHDIDEYQFNPRQADNNHFLEIKASIEEIGLQQKFSVVRDPKTKRYTLIKGGNTRLRAFKELYRETGDNKFALISCIVDPWSGEMNKTQAVIAHLVENEARGELILVDKARALIELELEYKKYGAESLTSGQTKLKNANIPITTQEFVGYLKDNGYTVSEKQLGLFRFAVSKLTNNLDYFLNQGMGSPQIIKIRGIYNNLKRITKDADLQDYNVENLDDDFSLALKKYNKTRKPFDFEKLLDVVISQLSATYPFFDIFASSTVFKKELLSTRKAKTKKPEENIDDLNNIEATNNTDLGNDSAAVTQEKTNDKDTLEEPKASKPNKNNNAALVDEVKEQVEPDKTGESLDADAVKFFNKHNNKDNKDSARLDFNRKNAFDLVQKITNKLHINNTVTQVETGCGFLLVDFVNEEKGDFEHWGVWWLLLGYSHAADMLNPILDLDRVLNLVEIKFENDILLTLYAKTNLLDVELVEGQLNKINELSGMYEYRAPNLQSVKDMLAPHIWQDITELESICYQIMRIVASDENQHTLWE